MCEVFQEYELCTCSDKIDKSKPYWILNKGIPKKDERGLSILGTLIYTEEEILREITEDRLLFDINSKNIFDFDYHPSENDVLKLFDGKFNYHFINSNNKWRVFDMSPFSNEKHLFKLRQKKKGFIEGSL